LAVGVGLLACSDSEAQEAIAKAKIAATAIFKFLPINRSQKL
jgi:hypothetical protein